MRIVRHLKDLPEGLRGAAVAIGNFDGVHIGHKAVIEEAGRAAKALDKPWAVMTFEPHPRWFFNPDQKPFRLTPLRDKAEAIADLGADVLIVQGFDRSFSRLDAETFVQRSLVDDLGARHVVAGYDFVFGQGRGGDCAKLLTLGQLHGFDFTAVRPQEDETGDVFSSTRVRECLWQGDVRSAADLLGRPFSISGRVRPGDQRGRTIGFPTANIAMDDRIRPALGVYAVRAYLDGIKKSVKGVANLGRRPTFGKLDELLEVHLFDFADDIYGCRLEVEFVSFLRRERKFDGIDALKEQIARDSQAAHDALLA